VTVGLTPHCRRSPDSLVSLSVAASTGRCWPDSPLSSSSLTPSMMVSACFPRYQLVVTPHYRADIDSLAALAPWLSPLCRFARGPGLLSSFSSLSVSRSVGGPLSVFTLSCSLVADLASHLSLADSLSLRWSLLAGGLAVVVLSVFCHCFAPPRCLVSWRFRNHGFWEVRGE
jgi:hypothetical protein